MPSSWNLINLPLSESQYQVLPHRSDKTRLCSFCCSKYTRRSCGEKKQGARSNERLQRWRVTLTSLHGSSGPPNFANSRYVLENGVRHQLIPQVSSKPKQAPRFTNFKLNASKIHGTSKKKLPESLPPSSPSTPAIIPTLVIPAIAHLRLSTLPETLRRRLTTALRAHHRLRMLHKGHRIHRRRV